MIKTPQTKIIIKIFLEQIDQTDQYIACRVVVSKTKPLFKNQFIFCQKHVKARIHTFFIQFVKN